YIANDLSRKREDAAISVEPEFRVDDFVEAVGRRREILQPVARPAHRPTEVTGENRNDDLLLIQGCLAAKTAAHIGRYDADTVSRHLETLGEEVANDARDLRRRRQGQRTTPSI